MSKTIDKCKETWKALVELIKYLIDDYKQYKKDEEEEKIFDENREKMIEEGKIFNKNTGLYHFERVVEFNGVPHTFASKEVTEDWYHHTAFITLLKSHSYEKVGILKYDTDMYTIDGKHGEGSINTRNPDDTSVFNQGKIFDE